MDKRVYILRKRRVMGDRVELGFYSILWVWMNACTEKL